MEIKWRTIGIDGFPPAGTFCLCKLVHEFNSWSDYTVLQVVNVYGKKMFQKYDLIYPDKQIIKYIPISELEKENG